MPVATAMDAVYGSMLAADGSKDVTYFSLLCKGSYTKGEESYTFDFGGAFDVTPVNREEDRRSQVVFEIKKGAEEVFLMYYSDGKLYLHFPPYASRACISDYNLAKTVHEINLQKKDGVISDMTEDIPLFGNRVFTGCKLYSEEGVDRYVFTLSYARLFETLSSFITSWDAGFTPAEFLSVLRLDDAATADFLSDTAATTVEFRVKDGVFLSAKADRTGKGALAIDEFSLTGGTVALVLPAALSTFEEYDFRSLELSGTLNLKTEYTNSDRAVNYGVTVNREYVEVTYPFSYVFKSHYVAGSGLEFALDLTDKNQKESFFSVKGEYLYVDLTDYGIAKCKLKTADLKEKLRTTGFSDTEEYDFKDKLRLLALILSSRTEKDGVVSYTLGAEAFSLLSERIGFKGLFGASNATISWDASSGLRNLTADLRIGGMTLALSSSVFTLGKTQEITLPQDEAEYCDLATRETTHISASGTMTESTSFSSDAKALSALLSSLSGETVALDATGSIGYTADFVYGATGAMKHALLRFSASNGTEIVNLYFTDETPHKFYLIYPAQTGDVRKVRTLDLAENPLAAFNEALGASESEVGNKILLSSKDENTFMIGVHSPMISFVGDKLKLLYPDLDLSYLTALRARRYELQITDSLLTGKVVFDSDNYLTIKADRFYVTFGDDVALTEITFDESARAVFAQTVKLLSNNDMPVEAIANFTDGLTYRVSLKDFTTGEKIWTYENVPENVGVEGASPRTVTAKVSLFGKTLTETLTVDISPASSVELQGSAEFGDRINEKTFSFSLYKDVNPEDVLKTFRRLDVTVGVDPPYNNKEIVSWDTRELSTGGWGDALSGDFIVKPRVKTYFGNEVTLGTVANFTVHIDGEAAVSTDATFTFKAYESGDPFDSTSYPDKLTVFTKTGKKIADVPVEWVTDVGGMSTVKKAKNRGELYAFETEDKSKPNTVVARVLDSTGNFTQLSVPVFFEKKVVETVDFDETELEKLEAKGVKYTNERDDRKGTVGKFTFDVFLVRGLSSTTSENILPRILIANKDNKATDKDNATDEDNATDKDKATEFSFRGGKWVVESVSEVENASGKTGILSLKIGNAISGYQTIAFSYEFTGIVIEKTALLDAGGKVIAEHTKADELYRYAFTNLNVYTYRYPKAVRVTWSEGETEKTEVVPVTWKSSDETAPAFREVDFCSGGSYAFVGKVGSAEVTLSLSFDEADITDHYFTKAELPSANNGKGVLFEEKQEKYCLVYSVLSAINGEFNYVKPEDYPAVSRVCFNKAARSDKDAVVPVSWDLSVFDGKENMIATGGLFKVQATALIRSGFSEDEQGTVGQTFDVWVYVASAVSDEDSVYLDDKQTEGKSFRLIAAADDKNIVVTDPRDVKNYPEFLYVKSGSTDAEYLVPVKEWIGIDAVRALYAEAIAAGISPEKVATDEPITMYAKIGDDSVGYSNIPIRVTINACKIENKTVGGIPFTPSTQMTGGTTMHSISPTYTGGIFEFASREYSYDFLLSINPYYVKPRAQETYPTVLNFDLDGRPASVKLGDLLAWDYSNVDRDAAKKTETRIYPITAVITLVENSADFLGLKINVPAALEVQKRMIDKVYITEKDGRKHSDAHIDLHCYEENPFGGEVANGEVTLDVTVQFAGDATEYPLKLKYHIQAFTDEAGYVWTAENVVISHSRAYYDVTVRVGNESGGWQKIEGYEIRVIAHVVSQITARYGEDNAESDVFYSYDTEKYTESYSENTALYVSVNCPRVLDVVYFDGSSERVYRYDSEDAKGKGVVFDWVRKDTDGDGTNELGAIFWNPTLNAINAEAEEDRQAVYNANITGYITLDQKDKAEFFDAEDPIWSTHFVYRDEGETGGVITTASVIDARKDSVLKGLISEEKYLSYYLTTEAAPKVALDPSAALNAGAYRLYVRINHSLYKGDVYQEITIDPKDISESIYLYVNGARREGKPKAGGGVTPPENMYAKEGYNLTARSDTHADILLYVDGVEEKHICDVNYEGGAIIAYTFTVTVATDPNHTAKGKQLSFKITEAPLFLNLEDKKDRLYVDVAWNAGAASFDVTVTISDIEDGKPLSESSTNGYKIQYFSDESSKVPLDPSALEVRTDYYYRMVIKIKNYESAEASGSCYSN